MKRQDPNNIFKQEQTPLALKPLKRQNIVYKRLYTPSSVLQVGQVCLASLSRSTQNGMRQQPKTKLERTEANVRINHMQNIVYIHNFKHCSVIYLIIII